MQLRNLIYLDNNATTATDPTVVDKMMPYFYNNYGNPSSNSHLLSWKAEEAIFIARQKVAKAINAHTDEIYFTSGATEGNNMVIKGLDFKPTDHIVTTNAEHKCVIESTNYINKKTGVAISFVPVDKQGMVNLKDIQSMITEHTKLVSVMYVNNEVHSINDIANIGLFCRENDILFHVDGAQAIGKLPLDVKNDCIDFLTLSSHKFYGPKGSGAIYVRKDVKHLLTPLLHGGGQEGFLRSGTLALPLIVGLGEAIEIACNDENTRTENKRITWLSQLFFDRLEQELDVKLNGAPIGQRQLGGLNFTLSGIDTGELQFHVPRLCYSRGSACSSGSLDYSYVLKAIGLTPQEAIGTMRMCIGRFNTEEEVVTASKSIVSAVKKLTKSQFHLFSDII